MSSDIFYSRGILREIHGLDGVRFLNRMGAADGEFRAAELNMGRVVV